MRSRYLVLEPGRLYLIIGTIVEEPPGGGPRRCDATLGTSGDSTKLELRSEGVITNEC